MKTRTPFSAATQQHNSHVHLSKSRPNVKGNSSTMGVPAFILWLRQHCLVFLVSLLPWRRKKAVVDLGVARVLATYGIDLEASPAAAAMAVRRFERLVRGLLLEVLPDVEELHVSVVAPLLRASVPFWRQRVQRGCVCARACVLCCAVAAAFFCCLFLLRAAAASLLAHTHNERCLLSIFSACCLSRSL